jgi:hypothetical protein
MTQKKIDATDAPPQGAIEWLVEKITKHHDKEFSIFYKAEIEQALQIQEHMVRHAYNHGWDDREYEVEDSWKKDADEKYFNETYGQ